MKIGTCIRGNHIFEDLEDAITAFREKEIQTGKRLLKFCWQGDITVEGYHDAEYCGDREQEGQRLALEYLKGCM